MENELLRKSAKYLTGIINCHINKKGIELRKMEIGMETVIINVSKFILVYLLAAIFNVLPQTFIVHLSFFLVKLFSFGLHALNSTVCTLISCCLFVLIPFALSGMGIGNYSVAVVFAAVIFVLYRYAPADTKARPIIGATKRKKLKKKAIACGLFLMAVALLLPDNGMKLLLTLGAVYQSVFILPITYKILKRSGKNYENFERA